MVSRMNLSDSQDGIHFIDCRTFWRSVRVRFSRTVATLAGVTFHLPKCFRALIVTPTKVSPFLMSFAVVPWK